MEENYTVYMHTAPNGKRYIGITCLNPQIRWGRKGSGYSNQVFYRSIRKYGWENIKHEILFEKVSKQLAESKEIELIEFYQSNNPQYGYNIANGGNSTGKHSEITKKKISDSLKGLKNPFEGKQHSEEVKEIISEAMKGRVFTEEHKRKIGVSNTGKSNKIVFQYRTNGELVAKHYSTIQASKDTKISRANISAVLNGHRLTAGGFVWKGALEE